MKQLYLTDDDLRVALDSYKELYRRRKNASKLLAVKREIMGTILEEMGKKVFDFQIDNLYFRGQFNGEGRFKIRPAAKAEVPAE